MSLTQKVATLIEARKLLNTGTDTILPMLKDQTIPLDERWEAYTNLVKNHILTKNECYGDGFIYTLGDSLTMYDDFYVDRGQTLTFPDMYEKIDDLDLGVPLEDLIIWQEKVLASGLASFTYDW